MVFYATRPSLCQRDLVGTSTLQTGKRFVKLALVLEMKKETTVVSWLVPLLVELHHRQT